ncbi:MAG: transporter permease [Myxococcales bacterium]|nr:transporter permease [Myxococcales bacterium]
MGPVGTDVRFALRMFKRSPGVTAAAVLALALGIGANTAIFSVVDGVLLRPLPFPDSRALFIVHTGNAKLNRFDAPFSYPEYQDLVAQTRTLESVGAWCEGDANFSGGAAPERVLIRLVTPSLLPTLRVEPVRGRNFLAEETLKGRDHVAIIDYGLWQRQFSGSADAVGRSIRLDGTDYQIIGILPKGLKLERGIDVWLPLSTSLDGLQVRNSHFLRVLGRRRAEASPANIAADLQAIGKFETDTYPAIFPSEWGFSMRARPYLEEVIGDVRLPLFVLLGAVAFVLLIACANVANLLLARAATRQREMAIRTALGARRGRIVRQLLTESLLLSLAGGALGVLFAAWGIDALVSLSPDSVPRVAEVALDVRVLLFTAAIAIATGIAFGLVPAISASRPDLHDSLKDGTRGTTSGRGRLRKALVVVEVALSLVLLVGAGLMVRSFVRLRQVDPGFRPDHALMLRISLPVADNVVTEADRDRFVRFFARAAARLRQLPGVTHVGSANILPLDGGQTDRLFDIEGYVPTDAGDRPDAENRQATPGWFSAVGMPLVGGRVFEESDDGQAPPVVVVNRAFVKRFFPKGDALGKRMRLGPIPKEHPWATIIGIVGDVRGYGLDEPARAEMYWPMAQNREASSMALVVRTQGDPAALATTARSAIAELDPAQPIFDVQPLERLVAQSLGQRRFMLTLMLLFGLVALVLAAVGIYGVMAYTVAQRTQEIGIRVALGAQPGRVLGMVLRDGMTLVGTGLVIGTGAALALTRLASSLLYGVSTADVGTYVVIAAALAAVALVAIVLPARRAMRVDPMQALRSE